MQNIVLLAFHERIAADEAMSELRRLADDGELSVKTAVSVERMPDGRFRVRQDAENVSLIGTGTGGAIGALVGALAGPLGLLVGGATGATLGTVLDADDAGRSELVVSEVMRRVPPGSYAVVADVDEVAPDVLDAVASSRGGSLIRRSWLQVQEELEAGR